ncbi:MULTISPECIES: hypothetical protein [unclassified Methanoregula]|uniref:hypothetical protein n=1 Tax=unclassified Methanoregula TaxID=2649730 RepID=UPI0009CC0889|nr:MULTISPECIES: hypothetical protein [unclassified Methanoregula]OPX62553.1 MAG: hypothetical protein A4E33_02302 [Methanoregula sp. PtaB.Bin085]OPY31652.1 MAG: hypothetical protein A4E34_02845 [Methanoregula sp. PtaU1.Bin006]
MTDDGERGKFSGLENPVFLAYALTGTFLLIFLLVVLEGPKYNDNFKNPVWAVFLATVCILPPFLPELILFFKKHLTGFSYMGFSVSFSDMKMDMSCSWDELKLDHVEGDGELPGSRKVSPDGVIERIRILQQRGCTQYLLDLYDGRSWNLELLYFYLVFISSTTGIRQIIFVGTSRNSKQTFIGRAKLDRLIEELDRVYPEYCASAACGISRENEIPLGDEYETVLKEAWERYTTGLAVYLQQANKHGVTRIDAAWVARFCREFLNTDSVEYHECTNEEDARAVLRCRNRCIAVVDRGQYRFTIDRDKFALAFARKVMCVKR